MVVRMPAGVSRLPGAGDAAAVLVAPPDGGAAPAVVASGAGPPAAPGVRTDVRGAPPCPAAPLCPPSGARIQTSVPATTVTAADSTVTVLRRRLPGRGCAPAVGEPAGGESAGGEPAGGAIL